MLPLSNPLFGIYIHWPYCLSKCPYCDFFSHVSTQTDYTELLNTYKRDVLFFKNQDVLQTPVTSIFFGGGTPSLMPIEFFAELISFLKGQFVFSDAVEITLEANPDAIDYEKMIQFQKGGVTRLSLGVQSLNEGDLKFLGRRHSVQTALQRIQEAQEVFSAVNMDLIYARPNQTLENWEKELNQALDLGLSHYSLYQLTIEEGTPFFQQCVQIPDDSLCADFYLKTNEIMRKNNCPPYEISNYARKNNQCIHNLTYWRGENYLGIGPAAHGRINKLATQNPRSVQQWIKNLPNCVLLTDQEKQEERILMGLRLMEEGFPCRLLNEIGIQKAIQYKWGTVRNNLFYPTETGFLMLNQLILLLLPDVD